LLFNFPSENAIRKVQENEVALELNGTLHLLASTDDINLFGDNINTIKENAKILAEANRNVGL
jgi:hypothetical protein